MSEKLQNINTKTTLLADPTASKMSLKFANPAVSGQRIIVKNGTNQDIFVRGDNDDSQALAFPAMDGLAASAVEGTLVLAGDTESYELTGGMTQLSVIASAVSTGLVSIKVGEGL